MLTSEKTCMLTLYCQEEPLCTQVLLTECKKKLLDLLPRPSRLKSLLHQRGNTLYGLEDPSLLHSPPSSLCGYPSRNMMSLAQELFIVNASKDYYDSMNLNLPAERLNTCLFV